MGKRILRSALAALGILLLILDSRTALAGAQDGIELCFSSVIPSIFPFLVLCGMLTPAIIGVNNPAFRLLSKLLRIPPGSEGIFFTGILGGYPTGAQAVYSAWKRGQITKDDAQRMLAFCSNAGPSFLFGILGTKFADGWMLWMLWGIHILSAVTVAVLLPGRSETGRTKSISYTITLTQSLRQAVVTMGSICGWVVLFRMILAFGDRWVLWLLPMNARVAVYGVLELANGCCSLEHVSNIGMRFILCSGMLSFGGICVVMQTASVTGELGAGKYLHGKILQTLISFLFSVIVQHFLLPSNEKASVPPIVLLFAAMIILFLTVIPAKMKNRGSNPSFVGV